LGAEARILRVGSTREVLTKISTAGLMVIVTMSLTVRKRYSVCCGSTNSRQHRTHKKAGHADA
jgi:hypothetical protein